MNSPQNSNKLLNSGKPVFDSPSKQYLKIDRTEFIEIYENYWETLYAIGYNRIRSQSDVEDIIQEIFAELWKRRDSIQVKSCIRVYLMTAIKYKVIDFYRQRKINQVSLDDLGSQQESFSKTDQLLSFNELFDRLKVGVENLPTKCRLIFKMSREEGLSSEEIAKQLKISKRTVETQIYKSLKSLKSDLSDYALFVAVGLFF